MMGSEFDILVSSVVSIVVLLNCTATGVSVMRIVSVTWPSSSLASTVTLERVCTLMFSWTKLRKPGISTVRL
jgi:hypothetical protein